MQGYHKPCGITAQQVQYDCTPPSCVAGTALDLTGSCSTALTGGTLSYIGADGAPPPAVCPGPGEIVPVYPVVADGDCTYDGPAFGVTGELDGVCEFEDLYPRWAVGTVAARWPVHLILTRLVIEVTSARNHTRFLHCQRQPRRHLPRPTDFDLRHTARLRLRR